MFGAFSLAPSEILVLLAVGRRLPDFGPTLGRTLVDFRKAVSGGEDDLPCSR